MSLAEKKINRVENIEEITRNAMGKLINEMSSYFDMGKHKAKLSESDISVVNSGYFTNRYHKIKDVRNLLISVYVISIITFYYYDFWLASCVLWCGYLFKLELINKISTCEFVNLYYRQGGQEASKYLTKRDFLERSIFTYKYSLNKTTLKVAFAFFIIECVALLVDYKFYNLEKSFFSGLFVMQFCICVFFVSEKKSLMKNEPIFEYVAECEK